ncbi:MAG: sugar transferase [Hyphomicrobium sp.]
MVALLMAVSAGFVLFRLEGVARSLPLLHAIISLFLISGLRLAARFRQSQKSQRRQVENMATEAEAEEAVLIVGINSVARLFLMSIAEFAPKRIAVVGFLANTEKHTGRVFRSRPILGSPENIVQIVEKLEVEGIHVDRIIVATEFEELPAKARSALLQIERRTTTRLELIADRILGPKKTTRAQSARPEFVVHGSKLDPQERALTMFSESISASRPYWRVKRAVDVVLAATLLVLLSPVTLLVALLVAIDVGFPVLFAQQRPGTRGRPFKVYKFRTLAAPHDENGRRVREQDRTRFVGDILRKLRLDELPQLFNILVGQMSFVGPRPLLPHDQPYGARGRLLVRPGLTGWAQVNGGRNVSAIDKTALDFWYITNASLMLDLKILFRTLLVVLGSERENRHAADSAWALVAGSRPPGADLAKTDLALDAAQPAADELAAVPASAFGFRMKRRAIG